MSTKQYAGLSNQLQSDAVFGSLSPTRKQRINEVSILSAGVSIFGLGALSDTLVGLILAVLITGVFNSMLIAKAFENDYTARGYTVETSVGHWLTSIIGFAIMLTTELVVGHEFGFRVQILTGLIISLSIILKERKVVLFTAPVILGYTHLLEITHLFY